MMRHVPAPASCEDRRFSPPRLASLCLLAGFALSGASCQPGGSSGIPLYEVRFSLMTELSPGVLALNPTAVGKKTVIVTLEVHRPMTIHNFIVSAWPAGHNADAVSVETPVDQEGSLNHNIGMQAVIPGSENLALCDAMYYTVAFGYSAENDPDGMYISQAKLIQPLRQLPDLTVTADCDPPPPADE